MSSHDIDTASKFGGDDANIEVNVDIHGVSILCEAHGKTYLSHKDFRTVAAVVGGYFRAKDAMETTTPQDALDEIQEAMRPHK